MGVIKHLFGKEPSDIRIQDIQSLIDIRREEDRHLEYKAPRILGEPEKLSEWISAFLNADGGVIIVGVCEDKPAEKEKVQSRIYPTRIELVGAEYPKERVEQLIYSHISADSRPIIGVYPVRDDVDPSKAIYLVEVPEGDNPPYQAGDGKYYRRLNATKYAMPHREIADFFGRRRKPQLTATLEFIDIKIEDSVYQFTLRILLHNEGKALARHVRFTASFSNLEIVQMSASFKRIDELRGNTPSIQFNDNVGVYYPEKARPQIGNITLKMKNNAEVIRIEYDVIAEDMELFEDAYTIDVKRLETAKERIEQGRIPTLAHPKIQEEKSAEFGEP